MHRDRSAPASRVLLCSPRLRTRLWPLLVACGAWLVAEPARASELALSWQAPASCPDEQALKARVERLLGDAPLELRNFEARASVTEDGDGGFTLSLWIRTAAGEGMRSVRADACEDLLGVAAFGIALALNPELRASVDGIAEPAPVAPAPPPIAKPPDAGRETRARELLPDASRRGAPQSGIRTQAPDGYRLGVELRTDFALLPRAAPGVGVWFDTLALDHLRIGFVANLFVPQVSWRSDGSGGRFSLWSADAHGCYTTSGRIALGLCAAMRLAVIGAEGRNVAPRLDQQSTIYAPGVSALGLFSVTRALGVRVALDGFAPLTHDQFVVNSGPVHAVPWAFVEIAVGTELVID